MKQVIFIGFSTTGKSTLINNLSIKFPNRIKFDTDEEIAKNFGGSIANIYYSNENINDTHSYINNQESTVLINLMNTSNNLMIAAGPGIPLRSEYSTYVKTKQPHIVLIERPAEDIYRGLLERRNNMKKETVHQRKEFGIWDVDVMVDKKLEEFSKEIAIKNIQSLLDQRQDYYNKFSPIRIKSSDIFNGSLPNSLLEIL